MAKIGTDIDLAVRLLNAGKIVGIPTDTVYGLAGNAFDGSVIKDIYQIKGRDVKKALIVQVDSIIKVKNLVMEIPNQARILAEKFWPGALTLVLEAKFGTQQELLGGGVTIGIRIPKHEMTLDLLSRLDFPLAVTSANVQGQKSPLTAIEVNEQLGTKIEYTLDGGKCGFGLESTIVGFDSSGIKIFREGAISEQEIIKTLNFES